MGRQTTTELLRRNNTVLNDVTKARYRRFLETQVGSGWPAESQEETAESDSFYEGCSTWLRESTRDSAAFPVLFNELIAYGFRRNLFGLKWIGLGLDAVLLTGCTIAFWGGALNLQVPDGAEYVAASVIAFLHAIYFAFFVTARRVRDAGHTYARQLILSCDKLIGQRPVGGAVEREVPA